MSRAPEAAYIRITKTGSTSIYNSLSRERCITVAAKRRDIRKKLPLDGGFIFTFVRNPYARITSSYEMLTRPQHSNIYRSDIGGSMIGVSFGEFLDKIREFRTKYEDFYLTKKGGVHILNLRILRPSFGKDNQSRDLYKILHHTESMVDTIEVFCPLARLDLIGRIENIATDFYKIPEKLRVEEKPPHLNVSKNRAAYQSYYNAQTIRTVSDMYEKDLATFGYSFEAHETKPARAQPRP